MKCSRKSSMRPTTIATTSTTRSAMSSCEPMSSEALESLMTVSALLVFSLMLAIFLTVHLKAKLLVAREANNTYDACRASLDDTMSVDIAKIDDEDNNFANEDNSEFLQNQRELSMIDAYNWGARSRSANRRVSTAVALGDLYDVLPSQKDLLNVPLNTPRASFARSCSGTPRPSATLELPSPSLALKASMSARGSFNANGGESNLATVESGSQELIEKMNRLLFTSKDVDEAPSFLVEEPNNNDNSKKGRRKSSSRLSLPLHLRLHDKETEIKVSPEEPRVSESKLSTRMRRRSKASSQMSRSLTQAMLDVSKLNDEAEDIFRHRYQRRRRKAVIARPMPILVITPDHN